MFPMADVDLNELEPKVSNLPQDKGGLTVEEISKRLGIPQAYIHTVLRTRLNGFVTELNGVWELVLEK